MKQELSLNNKKIALLPLLLFGMVLGFFSFLLQHPTKKIKASGRAQKSPPFFGGSKPFMTL